MKGILLLINDEGLIARTEVGGNNKEEVMRKINGHAELIDGSDFLKKEDQKPAKVMRNG